MEAQTATVPEPVATCDTVVGCLNWLGVDFDALPRQVPEEEWLSVPRVVALVREAGLACEQAHLDWPGLQKRGFEAPTLILLKNRNVAVVTGGGRGDLDEVAVWDPLDPDGETLFIPRENFERAWSGHAVLIAPRPVAAEIASAPEGEIPDLPLRATTPAAMPAAMPRQEPSPPSGRRLRLAAITILAASAVAVLVPASLGDRIADPGTIRISFLSPQPIASDAASPQPDAQRAPSASQPTLASAPANSSSAEHRAKGNPDGLNEPPKPAPKAVPAAAVAPAPPKSHALAVALIEPTAPQPAAAAPLPVPVPAPKASVETPVATTAASTKTAAPAEAAATQAAIPAPPAPAPRRNDAGPAAAAAAAPAAASRGTAKVVAEATPAPSSPALSADVAAALIGRGDAFLKLGDVASARSFYERVADAGEWRGAVRLGETFDPAFLERARLTNVNADLPTALTWYRRARELGASEAGILGQIFEAQ